METEILISFIKCDYGGYKKEVVTIIVNSKNLLLTYDYINKQVGFGILICEVKAEEKTIRFGFCVKFLKCLVGIYAFNVFGLHHCPLTVNLTDNVTPLDLMLAIIMAHRMAIRAVEWRRELVKK